MRSLQCLNLNPALAYRERKAGMKETHLPPARVRQRGPTGVLTQGVVVPSVVAQSSEPGASQATTSYPRQSWVQPDDPHDQIIDYPVAPVGPLGSLRHDVEAILIDIYDGVRPEGFAEEVTVQIYAEQLAERRLLERARAWGVRALAAKPLIEAITSTFAEAAPSTARSLAENLVVRWQEEDPQAEQDLIERCHQVGLALSLLLAEAFVEHAEKFSRVDALIEAADRRHTRTQAQYMGLRAMRNAEELHTIRRERAVSEAKLADHRLNRERTYFSRLIGTDE